MSNSSAQALTEQILTSGEQVCSWLDATTLGFQMRVTPVPLKELTGWQFAKGPLRLKHESGKFFSIVGIRHWGTFGTGSAGQTTQQWDQPMIDQPEVGILGFLTQVINGEPCLLVQAKLEPGNTEGAQLAPTVQATRSNYTRVHGGTVPAYLEYFQDHPGATILLDQLQSEQASRFLHKRNRNMLVRPHGLVPLLPNFRWVPWRVMADLLAMDKRINMDARIILSCVPRAQLFPPPAQSAFAQALAESMAAVTPQSVQSVFHWFTSLRATFPRKTMIVGLDELAEWRITEHAITRYDEKYFSVIGVQVETQRREVAQWSQPLIKHRGNGLNGLIAQQVGGTLRFLLRGCCYPGSIDNFELGSTVSLSDFESRVNRPGAPPFLEFFHDAPPPRVRHSSLQCEEGGRFFHYENRYMVVELDEGTITTLPDGYIWMTLGEIYDLLPHAYFSIEARNLLACLHAL